MITARNRQPTTQYLEDADRLADRIDLAGSIAVPRQLVVTGGQVIVGVMLSRRPVDRTLLHPLLGTCRQQLTEAGIKPRRNAISRSTAWRRETGAR